ncbi:MAG: hypothetical protein JOZ18_15310 [Chloroflexi bacterium]|nr:hypothetical protein [Chloroflexota bacterium]
MDSSGPPFQQETLLPTQPTYNDYRFANKRSRSTGCFTGCIGFVLFLLGIAVGVAGVLVYSSSNVSDSQALVTPKPPDTGAIIVQVSTTYITQLAAKAVSSSNTPGNVRNLQVRMIHNGPITIAGDDQFTAFGISITKHFTLTFQSYVRACQLQVHLLHADVAGIPIPVTLLASTFENEINQQLQVDVTNLPRGFVYCTTAVRTEPEGLFVTYSATPG